MFEKLKTYIRFWNIKPEYHIEGSAYGGLRMDIDKYYNLEENRKELKELNNSFGKIFNQENSHEKVKKERSSIKK